MPEQKHPTQDPDKHSEVAHMIADALGIDAFYDNTYEAWVWVRNDYDALYVDLELDETPDRTPRTETYRLTVERVK